MMGASRLIVLFLVRTLRHFTFASLVAAALLAHRPANAGIAIDNSSKVMVLYGYSMDLTKLELTSIHRILGSIVLPPFASDVKDALGADVEYVSDSILNVRLASAGL